MRTWIRWRSRFELSAKGYVRWTGIEDGKPIVFDSEPYAGFWKRVGVNMMRILPIDSML